VPQANQRSCGDSRVGEAPRRKEASDAQAADLQLECGRLSAAVDQMRPRLEETRSAQLEAESKLRAMTQSRDNRGPGAAGCYEWQYQISGSWYSFGADAMELAMKAYIQYLTHGSSTAKITSGGDVRQLDFQSMVQVTPKTGNRRKIRLRLHVPTSWTKPPHLLINQYDVCHMYMYEESSAIYEAIHLMITGSAHEDNASHLTSVCPCMRCAKIKSVHRIENFRLWREYVHRAQQLEESHGRETWGISGIQPLLGSMSSALQSAADVLKGSAHSFEHINEKWLFHGTGYDKAGKIVNNGFDHRLGSRSMYGAGAYFASESCKAHQYTCERHLFSFSACKCPVERTVIIARVALGDAYFTKKALSEKVRRPPERESGQGTYDSIIANPGPMLGHHRKHQDHQECVIFEKGQAYPAFVVQYTVS